MPMDHGKFMVIVDSPFLSTGTFRLFLAFFCFLPVPADGPDLVCYLPGLMSPDCHPIRYNQRTATRTELGTGRRFSAHVAMEEEVEEEGKKYRRKREKDGGKTDFPMEIRGKKRIFRLSD